MYDSNQYCNQYVINIIVSSNFFIMAEALQLKLLKGAYHFEAK